MDRGLFLVARCRRTDREAMVCRACAQQLKSHIRCRMIEEVTTPCDWPELGLTLDPILRATAGGRVVVA